MLCLAMLFAQLPQLALAAPSLTLAVSCGPAVPGSTTVTATGAGFGASQPIIYELLTGTNTVVFGGVQTSLTSGGFTLIFEVEQRAGTYTFRTAQDQNGNRSYDAGEPVASAQFTVPCASGGGGDAAPVAHAARLYALMNSLGGTPASSIEIVSLATMTSTGTISLGARDVDSLAISPDRQRAYVADLTNSVVDVIDLATGAQLATLAAPFARDVVLDPTGATLYVSTTTKLLAFSTATNTQLRQLLPQTTVGRTTPDSLLSVALSPDGATLATIGHDGSNSWVYLIDAGTFSLLARFVLTNPNEPSNCATAPNDVTFASATRLLLWDSNCDNLYEVDVPSHTQNTARTIRLGRDDGSSFNFNNALSYSAAADKAFVHTEGGAYAGASHGHFGVMDTAATTGSGAVGLGGTPFGTAVTPDGSSAYVAVIRRFVTTGANDVLDQYDIATNAFHENAYTFATAGQSVRDMKVVADPVSSIKGVAACGDFLGSSVVLRSGSVAVGQLANLVDGVFEFTNTAPNSTYELDYTAYGSSGVPVLVDGPPPAPITCGVTVTTDALGNATAPGGGFVPDLGNHNWTTAFRLNAQESATPGVTKFGQIDFIPVTGRSDWYVVHIAPGQKILVKLTGTGGNVSLPADFSLALFRDINAYLVAQKASLPSDPLRVIQNNDAATAPDALAPDAFAPDAFAPDALAPDALAPDAFAPDALAPDAFAPDELAPDELAPDAFAPDAFAPDALAPDAYAGAQTATILRVSAHEGASPEQIIQNTWSNSGDFYIRVRGHNGAFAASDGFQLSAEITSTACTNVVLQAYTATAGPAGAPMTLILTNSARFGTNGPAANYAAKLSAFAGRSDVGGLVLDLASNAGLTPAYAQWDSSPTCPAAANVVADAIKPLIDAYRPSLKYVVIAGGDHVIPWYRTPDQAGLGIESDFNPGLLQDTAGEASLMFGYTLTQDFYGTRYPIAHFDHSFFMPDLAVGRLVESSTDIIAVLDAYTAAEGVVHVGATSRALDTGYDFLSDTATFMQTSLAPSLTVDPLIQQFGQAPWTADQLRAKLFAQHYDIAALNGHFSANSLLASDFTTRIKSDEVAQFMALLTNTLVISSGCHSGFNIADPEAKPTTQNVDWPQALARAGAETIGSTGFAYGDTDFMKYTEFILGNFTTELRYDAGAIAIGTALVNAKHSYVASLPALRGIDEKALMEATLYGLPMWSIDLGINGRLVRPGTGNTINPTATDTPGLSSATLAPTYTLNRHPATGNGTTGVYWDADGNVSVAPSTPVLPLTAQSVAVAGSNARGVVLMDAQYVDEANVTPFTDVAGTELSGLHSGYASPVFAPVRPFTLNSLSGITTFVTTPAQFKTTGANSGILRRWTNESFQLFYSSRTDATAAFAGSPVVYKVTTSAGTGGAVRFEVTVGALTDPGFAGAYLTYTAEQGPQYGAWHSVPMSQVGSDLTTGVAITRIYAAEVMPGAGATMGDLRAFVQIVGGNGLVSMNTNNGAYYQFVADTATTSSPKQTTSLALNAPPSHGTYLGSTTVSATLSGDGSGLAGLPVTLTLGTQRATVTTNTAGIATATFTVRTPPGATTVGASFAEDLTHLAAAASAPFTIDQATPSLTGGAVSIQYSDSAVIATLSLGGVTEPQTVSLVANGASISAVSDARGRIQLDTRDLPLALGANSVVVSFAGNDRFTAATLTVTVTETAEDATVTLPSFNPQAVGTLAATAQVTQAADGSLGDLTRATVTFGLRNEAGTLVRTIVSPVSSAGTASAAFPNVTAGVYHVEATVTGNYTSALGYSLAVVYDTSTFVTGGGWVTTTTASTGVPAGRKATFGFVAKYLPGQTTPSGALEVSIDKTPFNFAAVPSFDWLVVSGGRAEIQGTGSVNKTGGYSFRLIAVDGSPDSFELRVWNTTTNPTSSFDAPLYKIAGTLGGGNIVVH